MKEINNNYKIEQDYKYVDEDWWKWWVWIEASDKDLDKIVSVVYTLHFSFPDPVRTVKNRITKFKMETSGWGIFTIYARVFLKDGTAISLEHDLHLEYPDGSENKQ